MSTVGYVMIDPGAPTFDRDHLPAGDWLAYRIKYRPMMLPVHGPFTAMTAQGPIVAPADFDGYLAVDQAGYPYVVSRADLDAFYELDT